MSRLTKLEEFVDYKELFIGGTLSESGYVHTIETEIVDIQMYDSEFDSKIFEVIGKEFGCSGNLKHLSVETRDDGTDWYTFYGYMHGWKIKARE